MEEVEFVTIGDLHLGAHKNTFPNYDLNPDDLILKAAKVPLEYARENGVKYAIFLGDIHNDPNPSQIAQKQFIEFLKKYSDLQIYLIPGNHDYSDTDKISLQMSAFTTELSQKLNHVHFMLHPELVYLDGVPFSFLPWPYYQTLHDPSVNIAHVEIKGAQMDGGKIFNKGFSLTPDNYYFIGHLHRYQVIGLAYFTGSLYQKTFAEPFNKGFHHVKAWYNKTKNKIKCQPEWIPTKPPFELCNLKVLHPQDLKKVLPPNPNKITQYRLLLRNGIQLPTGFLENHPNVIDVTGKLSQRELDSIEKENFAISMESSDVDILDGLDEFLQKDGLSTQQTKRANILLQNLIKKSGLQL